MRNLASTSTINPSSQEAIDLLDQLTTPSRLGQRPGLERITALLHGLGDPHRELRILHVGGTSGKGSTATIAARILSENGYRVGLHVKPHLEAVEERFVVSGRTIDPERLVELIETAAPFARAIGPSWYELTVALAFAYFRDEKVDAAVVEVGLGGTYDATNVIDPSAVILTNVGLDHTEVLGHTIELIATDKVGIVKPGVPVVSGLTQPSTREIVDERCRMVGASLWSIDRDFSYKIHDVGVEGSTFDLLLPSRQLPGLRLRPLGIHQVANAAVATAGVDALAPAGLTVDDSAIRRALANVNVAGRFEIVRRQPLVVLDGAHNPDKMNALTRTLDVLYPGRDVTAVLAFKNGHDLESTLRTISGRLRRAILTRFDATTDFGRGQALDPGAIATALDRVSSPAIRIIEDDPIVAVKRAIADATPNDLIVVTGSLYLVGVIRSWLRENP
jgi:dihydrofolate synthase/folylpolyglutamate synthase